MIVVDTKSIAELMRGEPHPAVLAWVAAQPRVLFHTAHIIRPKSSMPLAPCPKAPTGRAQGLKAYGARC